MRANDEYDWLDEQLDKKYSKQKEFKAKIGYSRSGRCRVTSNKSYKGNILQNIQKKLVNIH